MDKLDTLRARQEPAWWIRANFVIASGSPEGPLPHSIEPVPFKQALVAHYARRSQLDLAHAAALAVEQARIMGCLPLPDGHLSVWLECPVSMSLIIEQALLGLEDYLMGEVRVTCTGVSILSEHSADVARGSEATSSLDA